MKILVVAGEASADLHVGHLVSRLAKKHPIELCGIGGEHLKKLGLDPLRTPRDMAVVGLTEALKKIPQTLSLLVSLEEMAAKEKPDFALLSDLPDFNLRLAPRLKKLGIPVVYYISPQVWAWRSGRVHAMAKCIDLLLSILPFEKAWYEKNSPKNLLVKYVGHPALEEIPDLPYAPEENHIVLMPGSREGEWNSLFAEMIQAAALMHRGDAKYFFSLPVADSLRDSTLIKHLLSPEGPQGDSIRSLGSALRVEFRPAHELLRKAKAAWIASGTATLEAAIVGTPMVVVYRVSAVTAFLFRTFIRYKGPIAMVNLIHGGLGATSLVVPEVLQDDISPENLASAMRNSISESQWIAQRDTLAKTRQILSGAGLPLDNAAREILQFLEAKK